MSETKPTLRELIEDNYIFDTSEYDLGVLGAALYAALTALESYAALGRKVAALQCEDNLEFLPCGVVWLRGKYYPNIWAAFGLPKPPDDAGQGGGA